MSNSCNSFSKSLIDVLRGAFAVVVVAGGFDGGDTLAVGGTAEAFRGD